MQNIEISIKYCPHGLLKGNLLAINRNRATHEKCIPKTGPTSRLMYTHSLGKSNWLINMSAKENN